MRLMRKYFNQNKSASLAKDRLHIIIAQQRSKENSPDFLPLLRQDIMAAIAKHTNVNLEEVNVDLQCRENNSVLELNVVLPENIEKKVLEEA